MVGGLHKLKATLPPSLEDNKKEGTMDEYIEMCLHNIELARLNNNFKAWMYWCDEKRNYERGLPIGWLTK